MSSYYGWLSNGDCRCLLNHYIKEVKSNIKLKYI